MTPECSEHGTMLCYGQHGVIRLYRCELIEGTHKETWIHNNGKSIDVKPHTFLKSKEGQEIIKRLEE